MREQGEGAGEMSMPEEEMDRVLEDKKSVSINYNGAREVTFQEPKTKTHRIQFDVVTSMRDLLDDLSQKTGAFTRAEVVRRAISCYAILHEERAKGCHIELVDPEGNREIIRSII